MRRLIFLNLAIDQLWDPQQNLASLFPARIPESEHLIRINENLGLFLSNENDLVLGFKETKGYRQFLMEREIKLAPMLEITQHPFDQPLWLQEALQKLKNQGPFSELIAASVSPHEEALLSRDLVQTSSRSPMNSRTAADLNRKTFLLKLSKQGLIPVPETELIWQKDLVTGQMPDFSDQWILKHDFGSGGAANFSVSGSKDPIFHLLQRRLNPTVQTQWLLQKQISAQVEGSVFGWGDDTNAAQGAVIQYSPQGLSYRHDFEVETKLRQKAQILYENIKGHLSTLGYNGPIGLDFLQEKESDKLWAVDLNLRLTKTHVIAMALQKLGLSAGQTISLRHRWKSQMTVTFHDWWRQCQADFQLNARGETPDGNFLIPYSVAGIESPGGLKEVSVFISKSSAFETMILEKWGAR